MSDFGRKNSSSDSLVKTNITPVGLKNGVNLDYTLPNSETFLDGTLEVYLSGIHLNGDQDDPDRDFDLYTDNTGFTILIDPSQGHRLNAPPQCLESLTISYMISGVSGGCNPIIY